MNTQNNRHWNIDNPHFMHEITPHNVKVSGWCTLSASAEINCDRYLQL
jgi:hypothetical protein